MVLNGDGWQSLDNISLEKSFRGIDMFQSHYPFELSFWKTWSRSFLIAFAFGIQPILAIRPFVTKLWRLI